jgi:GT2 family glycosyltransferase
VEQEVRSAARRQGRRSEGAKGRRKGLGALVASGGAGGGGVGVSVPRKVSVAVVSWNGRSHLETCLQALAAQDAPGVDWEVLVLDNGSTDGTAEWLRRERPPRVRLIESRYNVGFCAGNNRLVAEAAGDAVALLNNDTRPRSDWLGALVEALGSAPADVAAVSGQIVDWEGGRLDFGRGVMTFDGHAFQLDFRRPLAAARLPAAGEELLFACGGNMLIRRASFLAAGGFDASFFAYLEDVDLGWRLWSGGERVIFAPGAVVHHRSSATSDLLGLYNRGFLFERNAFLTAYKNYEPGLWEQVMPALLLTFLSRTQAMLAANPGGTTLLLDPYAGWIANTAGPAKPGASPAPDQSGDSLAPDQSGDSPAPDQSGERPAPERSGSSPAPERSGRSSAPNGSGASPVLERSAEMRPEWSPERPVAQRAARSEVAAGSGRLLDPRTIARKWRQHGTRELWRRGLRKLRAGTGSARGGRAAPAPDPSSPSLTDERTVAQLRALSYLLGHLDQSAAAREAVQRRRRCSDREIFARFPLYLVPTYPGDARLFADPGFAAWLPADLPLCRQTLEEVMEIDE